MESQENCSGMNLNGRVLLSSDLRKDTFVGWWFVVVAHLFGEFLKNP